MSVIKCHLCPISLPNKDEMEIHISAVHHNFFPYKCLYCLRRELRYFPTEKQIIDHSKIDHPGNIHFTDISCHSEKFHEMKVQVQSAIAECIRRNSCGEETVRLNQNSRKRSMSVAQRPLNITTSQEMASHEPAHGSPDSKRKKVGNGTWVWKRFPMIESAMNTSTDSSNSFLTNSTSTENSSSSQPSFLNAEIGEKRNESTDELNLDQMLGCSTPQEAQGSVVPGKAAKSTMSTPLTRKESSRLKKELIDLTNQ
ncbi:hypothetical protein Ddc_16796 [Ditylenchus destructor]|nr:hypothetical protein Ddc_16796 [Ditylenchus destructor]